MTHKILLTVVAIWVTGSMLTLSEAHAAASRRSQSLQAVGVLTRLMSGTRESSSATGMLLLTPATRVTDAAGRPLCTQSLGRGAMVNYSAVCDGSAAARPKATEITILPSGQRPRQNDG